MSKASKMPRRAVPELGDFGGLDDANFRKLDASAQKKIREAKARRVHIQIGEELHYLLKRWADFQGQRTDDIIRRLIVNYIHSLERRAYGPAAQLDLFPDDLAEVPLLPELIAKSAKSKTKPKKRNARVKKVPPTMAQVASARTSQDPDPADDGNPLEAFVLQYDQHHEMSAGRHETSDAGQTDRTNERRLRQLDVDNPLAGLMGDDSLDQSRVGSTEPTLQRAAIRETSEPRQGSDGMPDASTGPRIESEPDGS